MNKEKLLRHLHGHTSKLKTHPNFNNKTSAYYIERDSP